MKLKIKFENDDRKDPKDLTRLHIYKPDYSYMSILLGIGLLLLIIVKVAMQDIVLGEFVAYLLMFILVAAMEMLGFTRAVVFEPDHLKFFNGFQYKFKLSPTEIPYKEITSVNEVISAKSKFSNLQITASKKTYSIFIHSICHYREMKAELETKISCSNNS